MAARRAKRQVPLDSWQLGKLESLLGAASEAVSKTGRPIVLYRQTVEEQGDSHEEIVCTLAEGYVVEQQVTSGGVLVPEFGAQRVYRIPEYPQVVMDQSKERFSQILEMLESLVGPQPG